MRRGSRKRLKEEDSLQGKALHKSFFLTNDEKMSLKSAYKACDGNSCVCKSFPLIDQKLKGFCQQASYLLENYLSKLSEKRGF